MPAFETARAEHVRIRAEGRWAHIDQDPREVDGDVTIDVVPRAVRVLVPAP